MGGIPFAFVQRQMATKNHRQSYVSRLIQFYSKDGTIDLSPEDRAAIQWSAAALFGAAADTTAITMTAFTAAMALHPHVQKTAQSEIDRVVGMDRLPGVEDRENLPYINAIVKESLRWFPVAPMGIAHCSDEDIECVPTAPSLRYYCFCERLRSDLCVLGTKAGLYQVAPTYFRPSGGS